MPLNRKVPSPCASSPLIKKGAGHRSSGQAKYGFHTWPHFYEKPVTIRRSSWHLNTHAYSSDKDEEESVDDGHGTCIASLSRSTPFIEDAPSLTLRPNTKIHITYKQLHPLLALEVCNLKMIEMVERGKKRQHITKTLF